MPRPLEWGMKHTLPNCSHTEFCRSMWIRTRVSKGAKKFCERWGPRVTMGRGWPTERRPFPYVLPSHRAKFGHSRSSLARPSESDQLRSRWWGLGNELAQASCHIVTIFFTHFWVCGCSCVVGRVCPALGGRPWCTVAWRTALGKYSDPAGDWIGVASRTRHTGALTFPETALVALRRSHKWLGELRCSSRCVRARLLELNFTIRCLWMRGWLVWWLLLDLGWQQDSCSAQLKTRGTCYL